jgi:hypothetical protein
LTVALVRLKEFHLLFYIEFNLGFSSPKSTSFFIQEFFCVIHRFRSSFVLFRPYPTLRFIHQIFLQQPFFMILNLQFIMCYSLQRFTFLQFTHISSFRRLKPTIQLIDILFNPLRCQSHGRLIKSLLFQI